VFGVCNIDISVPAIEPFCSNHLNALSVYHGEKSCPIFSLSGKIFSIQINPTRRSAVQARSTITRQPLFKKINDNVPVEVRTLFDYKKEKPFCFPQLSRGYFGVFGVTLGGFFHSLIS
jgi:hypothetical protein